MLSTRMLYMYIDFYVLFFMYHFHYDYIKPKYTNISLNYMDTDFFIYDIKTNDFYEDYRADISLYFNTSKYSSSNILNFPLLNKQVLGMMKDEVNGKIIKEFWFKSKNVLH